MPPTPSDRRHQPLVDIRDNIALARGFVAGMSYDAFVADRRTVYAVTRALEIISEAARRVPEDVCARHPLVPWQDIRGAGNVYRHDYEDVLDSRLWATVQHALDPLDAAVHAELARPAGRG